MCVDNSKISESLLLIIAYKRLDNVWRIIDIAKSAGIFRFMVQIDKARQGDGRTAYDQQAFFEKVRGSSIDFKVQVATTEANVGCAVNVLTAIDAAFKESNYCFILEDDCIPTEDFFHYAFASKSYLTADENLWLTCGTQVVPIDILQGNSVASSYALTWGWFTEASKWSEIRNALFSETTGPWSGVPLKEKRYWMS